jgi:hypothetical protein
MVSVPKSPKNIPLRIKQFILPSYQSTEGKKSVDYLQTPFPSIT